MPDTEDIIRNQTLGLINVLYVEDEEYIREGLARLLGRRIGKLFLAKNGKEGLEQFLKEKPDIVITDIRMPIMDGLEMAREIKKIRDDTPVIITTAYNDEEYFLRAIDIGIDKYIKKPVNKNELIRVLTNVSRTILQQKELETKNKFIRMILDNSPEFITICDQDEITYLNKSFLDFLGCESFDAFKAGGNSLDQYLVAREESFYRGIPFCKSLENLGSNAEEEVLVHMIGPGWLKSDAKSFLLHVNEIPDHSGKLVSLSDVTEIEKQKQLYQELSIKDPLTGIFNRKKFNEEVQKEVERARRYDRKISIIMFDIDHFKNVNDTYGHQVGDSVLQETSDLVNNYIRKTDFLARYGGEEFMVLSPETSCSGAAENAEKLREIIETHKFQYIPKLTCSFGVTELKVGEDLQSFLKRVDDALYEAKNRGRNMVVGIPVDSPTGEDDR